MKTCPACGQTRPKKHFTRSLSPYCRPCHEHANLHTGGRVGEGKTCAKCRKFLPWEAFYTSKSAYDLHYTYCIRCKTSRRHSRYLEMFAVPRRIPDKPLPPLAWIAVCIREETPCKSNPENA